MYKNTTALYIYTIIYIIYTLLFTAVGLQTLTAAMGVARDASIGISDGWIGGDDGCRGARRWAMGELPRLRKVVQYTVNDVYCLVPHRFLVVIPPSALHILY